MPCGLLFNSPFFTYKYLFPKKKPPPPLFSWWLPESCRGLRCKHASFIHGLGFYEWLFGKWCSERPEMVPVDGGILPPAPRHAPGWSWLQPAAPFGAQWPRQTTNRRADTICEVITGNCNSGINRGFDRLGSGESIGPTRPPPPFVGCRSNPIPYEDYIIVVRTEVNGVGIQFV